VCDTQKGVRAWVCAEYEEDAIVDTENLSTMSTNEGSSNEVDEEEMTWTNINDVPKLSK